MLACTTIYEHSEERLWNGCGTVTSLAKTGWTCSMPDLRDVL